MHPLLVVYEDDNIEMTCSVSGGLPTANLSLDCPGLTINSQRWNSSHTWLTASGIATRSLNGKTCTCTAQHYAWIPLGSNLRTTETPAIDVYCKFIYILTALRDEFLLHSSSKCCDTPVFVVEPIG